MGSPMVRASDSLMLWGDAAQYSWRAEPGRGEVPPTERSRSTRSSVYALTLIASLLAGMPGQQIAAQEPPASAEVVTGATPTEADPKLPEEGRPLPRLDRFNIRAGNFNHWVGIHVIIPIAKGYNVFVPKLLQESINNGIQNLQRPRDIVNSALQLKPKRAARHLGSLILNSTLGIGGLFYVSDSLIDDTSPETFDETLGHWGVPPGPYMVLPFVVPPFSETTVRSLVGSAGDFVMGPLFWLNTVAGVLGGTEGLIVSSSLTVTGGLNNVAMLMPGPFADESEWKAFDELVRERTPYHDQKRLYLENRQYDVAD